MCTIFCLAPTDGGPRSPSGRASGDGGPRFLNLLKPSSPTRLCRQVTRSPVRHGSSVQNFCVGCVGTPAQLQKGVELVRCGAGIWHDLSPDCRRCVANYLPSAFPMITYPVQRAKTDKESLDYPPSRHMFWRWRTLDLDHHGLAMECHRSSCNTALMHKLLALCTTCAAFQARGELEPETLQRCCTPISRCIDPLAPKAKAAKAPKCSQGDNPESAFSLQQTARPATVEQTVLHCSNVSYSMPAVRD